ncbi:Asp23/Gls24 family envelope stress response protein [Tenggerimyces flavus]|uniref:Asp23/Gls24 family envelope stress response protein n=1 Tax=Tenggerimyces flavus TaxID=1708749 RepID=A0ABV7YIU7_9ACTN|nr:hypothetical protein [Tenggerimyces flavus]MBM7789718.1 putative alkaline shock family protein YloU [Tenggerimyces flavus]
MPGRTPWLFDACDDLWPADVVAQAARAVPGVARLRPGVKSMLTQFALNTWQRALGGTPPDVTGVELRSRSARQVARVDVRIVVRAGHQAASVGQAVHDAIAAVVASEPQPVDIAVHIVELEAR